MLTLPLVLSEGYDGVSGGEVGGIIDLAGYDVAVGGTLWNLATTQEYPFTRRKVQATAERILQASEPGEATLTDWWRSAQSSFHGGAGQTWLDPAVPSPVAKIRYDTSFNLDPFEPGQVTRLPDTAVAHTVASAARNFIVTGRDGVDEYAFVAGDASMASLKFTGAGPTATASTVAWPVGSTAGAVTSVTTDGVSYFVGATYTVGGTPYCGVFRGTLSSAAAPVIIYQSATVTAVYVGWAKGRLMAAVGRRVYELDGQIVAGTNALPTTANFTHVATGWEGSGGWAESPTGILCGGVAGAKSDVVQLKLTDVAGTPTLVGGSIEATLPAGETVTQLAAFSGSFLAIGTSKGIRIGKWGEYSSALQYGPLTVETPQPVYGLEGRDRFVYGTGSVAQPTGESGLVAIDLSTQTDEAGRLAWAPHLPPPTLLTGTCWSVGLLPLSQRLIFTVGADAIIEGDGPGSAKVAWLRTSRSRMGTVEPKLFKLGRLRGTVDAAEISVSAVVPNGDDVDVLPIITFANVDGDPGEFRLPAEPREWMALQFGLAGATCSLNSYVLSGLPAPAWQWELEFTCLLYEKEVSLIGGKNIRPGRARDRWREIQDVVTAGAEVTFVENDPLGDAQAQVVVRDIRMSQGASPKDRTAFGGLVTFLLRTTEGA